MTENYLEMMGDSLQKKIRILQELERISLQQKELFAQGDAMDDDVFDAAVDRKGELIDELDRLDDGFVSLFEKVKAQIGDDKKPYAAQITGIQEQIRTISALSAAIEAQEMRNKMMADRYFEKAREELHKGKQTSQVAFSYYKNMNHFSNIPPQFFDGKK